METLKKIVSVVSIFAGVVLAVAAFCALVGLIDDPPREVWWVLLLRYVGGRVAAFAGVVLLAGGLCGLFGKKESPMRPYYYVDLS